MWDSEKAYDDCFSQGSAHLKHTGQATLWTVVSLTCGKKWADERGRNEEGGKGEGGGGGVC